jgi:hypothetical protein
MVVPRSVLSRATEVVANRLDRRSFLGRSALVGSALVTAPTDVLLRPTSAYAAICSCQGRSCDCGSLCCDGYTEFCCAIYGANACPTGSITGGWWKADGSSFCGGAARYYMDCHKPCGSCACGGSGICSGACNGTPCGCGNGRCDHRKAGCTSFRYGNCSNHIACIGPIQCRVVTCTPPWQLESSCSASAVRTDNNTRNHNRPCLQAAPPVHPLAGNWDGVGADSIGFYDNRTGRWNLRNAWSSSSANVFGYGQQPGDIPVVGDWDGDGRDGVAIFRRGGEWHVAQTAGSGTIKRFKYGQQAGDIPVAGDWDGDGRDGVGIFRRGGEWHLAQEPGAGTFKRFKFGQHTGDIPVVGDWDGDGRDGVGIFRRDGTWHLAQTPGSGAFVVITYGQKPGDVPVVGDWHGTGRDSIGIYRPSEGRWYLRASINDRSTTHVVFGERW